MVSILGVLDPEYKVTAVIRLVVKYSLTSTAFSYPRRLASSATPL